MGNQQETASESELGWLAGIIDGEGYIGLIMEKQTRVNNERIVPQLHITNCDEAIVLRARDIMRKLGVNPYIRASKSKGVKRDIYRLQTKRYAVLLRLLTILCPYMTGEKQERGEFVREFCEVRLGTPRQGIKKPHTPRELEIYEHCKPIQKRGSSETIRQEQRQTSEIWKIMDARQLEVVKI